ncbi:MAG: flagellar basal-body rod protein FlgF [Rhodocyclaceae bacterium]|nr:flagellar basal-body rod protein FlgF [Rhodocyclaceae bacterium]MBX3678376.1 flagellar basal-body rod protein FlgF [Rhodocyclaceae bacterium]MCB1893093.1 flagellar basal-body rod protein FlgF [Rhodocyclaceae bacterium]MCP5297443.1 flagellar basal-body rod protein FlgF [Zoogloeaceae bacterium]MCW5596424.1 flagellar basal-body rod protein FlgF [Rhodocyclaceae bacterium]
MDKLIYTAMSGAKHMFGRQASVAHNLANAVSTGFRAEEHRLRAVPVVSESMPTRAFAVDASIASDFTPGPITQTGRQLDVAVQGQGWLALALPDGSEAYTRNGSLEINVNGVLQTRNGIPVQGDGGPISIPPDNEITVGADGMISLKPSSGAQNTVTQVGTLKLVNPPEADLVRGADGLFRLRDNAAAPVDPNVSVAAGFLEGSNVNVVDQLVSMISLARQYETQLKLLSTAEQNDRAAAQLLATR